MAFNPDSTINLCRVIFDNGYKHVYYFETREEQTAYFQERCMRVLTDYLTVRKTLPDGGLQSSIKVGIPIDELRDLGINYIYYQNLNHSERYFYCFITKLIYINDHTTELVFETDVFQTWLFDTIIMDSFVAREHSETDEIGENIVPEPLNFTDYKYKDVFNDSTLTTWGYLIGATEKLGDTDTRGARYSGVYQGIYFYYFLSEAEINDFIEAVETEDGDAILFISLVPDFCLSASTIEDNGYVNNSNNPAEKTLRFDFVTKQTDFDGYTPYNKKLYTYPFYCLTVSNHNGQEAEYAIEDFEERAAVSFTMQGDVSANPSVILYPRLYKNLDINYDAGISIDGFPQCSFNTDVYKLWLTKNQFSQPLGIAGGAITALGGLGAMATGAGAAVGAGAVIHGAMTIANTLNTKYQASREPNRVTQGNGKNNLLTAARLNKFDFYFRYIKKEYAIMADNYFTMYGYQTNKVKKPNLKSRPVFNYVQTVGINIVGVIPNDDMAKLKAIYDNGVTLWKPGYSIGDYSKNNSPTAS